MNEQNELDDLTVASYALGVLDGPERETFERLLIDDWRLSDALAVWQARFAPLDDEAYCPVALTASTSTLTPTLIPASSVWRGIADRLDFPGPTDAQTRPADGGVWLRVIEGVTMKLLAVDPVSGERSALMRLEAGAVFEAHVHDQCEECYVIEGHIEIGGDHLRTGDYHVAPVGTVHDGIAVHRKSVLFLHWT